MLKGDGVRYDEGCCQCLDDQEASIVVRCWSDVKAWMTTEVPGFAGRTFGVCNDFASWWDHGHGVKVECSIEMFQGRDERV